jgi:hypothetical protein
MICRVCASSGRTTHPSEDFGSRISTCASRRLALAARQHVRAAVGESEPTRVTIPARARFLSRCGFEPDRDILDRGFPGKSASA